MRRKRRTTERRRRGRRRKKEGEEEEKEKDGKKEEWAQSCATLSRMTLLEVEPLDPRWYLPAWPFLGFCAKTTENVKCLKRIFGVQS